MAIIDASPHPDPNVPGYVFTTDDGNQVHLVGDEADQLKQHLDATRGEDQRLASNDVPAVSLGVQPTAPVNVTDAPQFVNISGPKGDKYFNTVSPEQGGDPAEWARMHAADNRAVPDVAPPQPGVPAQQAAPSAPTDQIKAGQSAIANKALDLIGGNQQPTVVPGVSRQQLQARAGQGVPVQKAMTVTGALNETPEEKQAREQLEKEHRDQRKAAMDDYQAAQDENVAAAQHRETAALNDAIQADNEHSAAVHRQQQIESATNQERVRFQGESDAAAKLKVDPGRLFHQSSTASNILSTLGVAFGAWGAAMTGTPNFALDIVNRQIDRDIASQQSSIESRQRNASNALSNFMDRYRMSREEATLAVKETQQRYIAAISAQREAVAATPQAKAQVAQFRMNMLQQADENEAKRLELTRGRVSQSFEYQYPHAGGVVKPKVSMSDLKTANDILKSQAEGAKPNKAADNKAALAREYQDVQDKLENTGALDESKKKELMARSRVLVTQLAGQGARTAFGSEGGQEALARLAGEPESFYSRATGGYHDQIEANKQWAAAQLENAEQQGGETPEDKKPAVPGAEDATEEE